MPRHLLLLTVLVGALVLPATASASFQARIPDIKHVHLTGTDDAEQLTIGRDAQGRLTHDQTSPGFASALDFDTTLPGVQSVTGPKIVGVDAEGGDDGITLTAAAAKLTADGGDGDDMIFGGPERDHILGGTGNDHADGGDATDRIYLGSGDDSAGWYSTEGSDVIDGGDGDDFMNAGGTSGDDEAEVDADEDLYAVIFKGAYSARMRATERLIMGLFDGDDRLITRPIPSGLRYQINGGPGDDFLVGGPDDDRVDGSAGYDQVLGAGGDDVLFGEAMVGDDGNDRMTMVLQDAGQLVAEGEGGYDATNIVTSSVDNALSVARDGAVATVAGAIISAEALRLNTGAGNDSVTVQPGVGKVTAVSLEGGSGDDVLRGSDGIEWLFGGTGQDLLDGGMAPDDLAGGDDADVIRARDRAGDDIDCAGGDDVVIADLAELDALADAPACEHVDRAAETGPIALARVAPAAELRLGSQDTVKVPVTCSAGARGGCSGTVTLVTAEPILMSDLSAAAALGRADISLAPGTTAEVPVFVRHGEDLARAAGGWRVPVKAQVLTAFAEHTTELTLDILR